MADNHFDVSDDFSSLEEQILKEEIELVSEQVFKFFSMIEEKQRENN